MCISLDTLDKIAAALTEFNKTTNNPLPLLKGSFPGVGFVRLSAGDIDEPPFRTLDTCNLYLLDAREHCVKLTYDPAAATGVVVAQR